MDDKDLYRGFAPEKQAEYEEWLIARFGEGARAKIEHSKAKWKAAADSMLDAALEEGGKAEVALVERFRAGDVADDAGLAAMFDRHRAWVSRMWDRECPPQAYVGLADLYLEHPDFRARYEAHGSGFAEWLAAGMKAYAGRLAA